MVKKLSLILQPHLAYKCSVKKSGTILYRHGGDLLHALNVAPGQVCNLTQQSRNKLTDQNLERKITETCHSLNTKLHACMKKLIGQDINSSTNSQCSFPLHTLITDTTETCGGSARLQNY